MSNQTNNGENTNESGLITCNLRSIPPFANFSDDELRVAAESIKEFALLLTTIQPAE